MAGYLDYWCSLDITGTTERNILTSQLESEFPDFEPMVETLIKAREERRLETARELEPIKACIFTSYQQQAGKPGLHVTPQLLEKMHEKAHQQAIIIRENKEQERANACHCQICHEMDAVWDLRYLNGQKATLVFSCIITNCLLTELVAKFPV
ncbi:hypothetical protein BT96DRAFT_1089407 [Gymnopus androsaceus JB14]|uniref:Uncharacterized protein n=1 Tax=Gymnopus androsaceus JB14 TaxID=1447944 RepID=A0A6A4GIZ6_9AGAR|nr:hypothetical protein BT96DRAFT_1089407 [Gymnopus androsaceus JB14]